MKTKTLQNAKNYSNESSHILFNDAEDYKDVVLGSTKFGAKDIDDVYTDYENNVENTLQDLASISLGQIGDIVIKDSNVSPNGYSQVDNWSFSSPSNIVYTEDTLVDILGKRVTVPKGATIDNIVIITQGIIQDYVDEGIYFSKVTLISNTELEVEYADLRHHDPKITLDEYNFSVTKSIVRNVVYGYGQWSYIGKSDTTTDISTVTLYYFKRIG